MCSPPQPYVASETAHLGWSNCFLKDFCKPLEGTLITELGSGIKINIKYLQAMSSFSQEFPQTW